ncbi:MAG: DUF3604 domain-containing protein [Rhodospirillaceae bacterium]|nr:DUF3604 domain-containing protein [Rhodospirillaceae bacterium]
MAGSLAELTLVYTAGFFGIDDSGMMKISWRTTSDMGRPQFDKPEAPNYTTVEASNGAVLDCRVDRVNIRPWTNTLVIRVDRGFLKAGDTITVRFGDRRKGSPGIRLQTNAEDRFTFKIYVDAFAAYEFTELPESPGFRLVPGEPVRWKAILPTLVARNERFRLALIAEDLWGNPTDRAEAHLALVPSMPVGGLPATIDVKRGAIGTVVEGLAIAAQGDLDLEVRDEAGALLCRANPMRVTDTAPIRRYWGDLHGQSEETVGTNSADAHFAFARDRAFLDIAGHQGNDFQISDAFWDELNRLTAAYDAPGRFLAVPGFEWSGNTGLGGDRNVFYRHEGRPIHRSSHILVRPEETSTDAQHTAHRLFEALAGEDAVVVAHVGGRYADVAYSHDPLLETSVEVHSTWGTFEWLLHDALAKGHRVGVVCHSDDHKGRPGATHPGASSFGAIGGLTCYLMPDLTRDSLFEALRRRHHYGTTGNRLLLELRARFAAPVTVFARDPRHADDDGTAATEATMGDIVRAGGTALRLEIEAIGTAPIESIDVFHGTALARSVRPAVAEDSKRLRLRWQGAEYRGRGRQTLWRGALALEGIRFARAAAVNFLNHELAMKETSPNTGLAWNSVTTGNMAGIDLYLERARAGKLRLEMNLAKGDIDLASLGDGEIAFDAGGLGRRVTLRRLPEEGGPRRIAFVHEVRHDGPGDLPVYVRVTQEDGHQAWSSPIYLIA